MLVLFTALTCAWSAPLPVPATVRSEGGRLDIVLTLERATIITSTGVTLKTRAFNGTVPGPTIRLKPGDDLTVHFKNQLPDQGSAYVHNQFSAADESNVHFHGLHVSGELPSDDSTVPVLPGQDMVYQTSLPDDHMAGTHWLHPHRHGSTALQVAGGAALALIVEDAPGTLPAQVEAAPEVLMVVMQIDLEMTQRIASRAGDSWFQLSDGSLQALVNGEVNPSIAVAAGEWTRFRVIYAGWLAEALNFNVGCEMVLLAKDGIYIRDFPRTLTGAAPIPAGGRADLMLRCPEANAEYPVTWGGNTIATVITGEMKATADLESWSPSYPSYLEDLRSTEVSPNCSCETRLDREEVNGHLFEEDFVLHQSFLGAVVERSLSARGHPYHQHVYPFQVISGFGNSEQGGRTRGGQSDGAANYEMPGDWHDTIAGTGVVRYQPSRFAGKVMVHCHRLDHEDQGMMSMEVVRDNGPCTCGSSAATRWIVPLPLLLTLVAGFKYL
ncbi:unnamed protein product [Cladocopium goreaui]|uniref:Multicopper oxidase mco n=1 Tax=Cladocopium goreaui TaxID=2562237 RepID=A0A9P1DJ70_9DINO|nr:unnamed protein product [Cladocopium goreaui]